MKTSGWYFLIVIAILSMAFSPESNQATPIFSYNQIAPQKAFRCTTFVYNLSTEDMRIRDICYEIIKISHNDLNEFNLTGTRDKKMDLWKFHIAITDNQKFTESGLDASFYIEEENPEFIQYNCIVESAEIKALIYNKIQACWQILVLQNENYKMLS